MEPLLVAITVTYGRVEMLNEAIACFLSQTHRNKQMIILNTYQRQKLRGEFPGVKIINCDTRPPSLGFARNMAVEYAPPDSICLVADDDDIALPHHYTNYAKHFLPGIDWVWQSKMIYLEASQIKGTSPGNLNCVAFRKSAFKKVGGYPDNMTVGEDRIFTGKITSTCPGKKVELADDEISFMYGWGSGNYHISGLGPDEKNQIPAHKRIEKWTEDRARRGLIPLGEITLKPELRHNYAQMVREHLGIKNPPPENNATVFVQLGKTGDLINMLPVAHHHFKTTGERPYIMVARDFASVLDGVSYVKPYPVDLTVHELNKAMALASQTFSKVIKTQIYGHNHKQETLCASWPQESWRQAGCLEHFHDPEWKLVFDARNTVREQGIVTKLFRTNKPKIVTNLTSADTCPFPNGNSILNGLRLQFPQYEVVDIGQLRCERLYDLIGVYEKAYIIVSIDTATSHLAAAVDVPLVALVNPNHWLGPVQRYNCVERIPYTEASLQRVCDAIRKTPEWMKQERERKIAVTVLSKPVKPGPKLDLKKVTLWACCWSEDRQNLLSTMRVLRYSLSLADFTEVILFSYLPLPMHSLPIRAVQIPKLDPAQWNIFATFTAPAYFKSEFSLSVHTDGFILAPEKWTEEFLKYDYIGACWHDGVVGNGGFCLESKRFYEAKMRLPFFPVLNKAVQTALGPMMIEPSDYFVCRTQRQILEEQGMKFAPRDVASRFSTEMMDKHIESFGWHGKFPDPLKFAHGWRLIRDSEAV